MTAPGEAVGEKMNALSDAPGGGWIDTHCHLDAAEFDADRAQVIAAARASGVAAFIIPAVEIANFSAVRTLAEASRGVDSAGSAVAPTLTFAGDCHAAYGIHPLYTPRAEEADFATLRKCLAGEQAVAVGEIGLDAYMPGFDMARQEVFFAGQLKLAQEFDLPVLLHSRRAVDLVLRHLRRIRVRGGIAHAFSGSRQQADEFLKLGFKLGFGGAMTFAGSTRIRRLATELPEDAIVLETDAPDMAPAWLHEGGARRRNEPRELPAIGAVLAELRGVTPAAIAAQTTANARAVLHF